MITYRNGSRCLQPEDSLEVLVPGIGAKRLYLDFEATSFKFNEYGNSPYRGHRAIGFSVTWDDNPISYYVPMRHYNNQNCSLEHAQRMLQLLVSSCHEWVNQNVKFDAHFAAVEGALFGNRLVCTLTRAKMLDSDRTMKGGYGLDVLSRDWLGEVITEKEASINAVLARFKKGNQECRDYAVVGPDIMGDYGCQDVLTARKLDIFERRTMPDDMAHIWEIETKLTPVLFDIEREGLRADPTKLQIKELQLMAQLNAIQERIQATTHMVIEPNNTAHCHDLLCGHYNLPVLEKTEKGNPSFDADALISYQTHPDVVMHAERVNVLKLMLQYKDLHTLLNTFIRPYIELQVDGILHSSYNQIVQTGRMSCKTPNAQQLSSDAKELIEPGEGNGFLSQDQSQIEFRVIAHYTKDEAAINSYIRDPDTDYHKFVAEMCGIPRKPAKTVNFMIGYGAGKKKVITVLSGNEHLIGDIIHKVDDMFGNPEEIARCERIFRSRYGNVEHTTEEVKRDVFISLCEKRGNDVYTTYHAKFPGIKLESEAAQRACMNHGFVKTGYGRRRHLPPRASWRAFNSVCQGYAADIMKDVTVQLAPRYNKQVRDTGLRLCAQVHDENLFVGPKEATRDPKVVALIASYMENPSRPLLVPVRTGAGWSDKNWKISSGDEGKISIDRSLYEARDNRRNRESEALQAN